MNLNKILNEKQRQGENYRFQCYPEFQMFKEIVNWNRDEKSNNNINERQR